MSKDVGNQKNLIDYCRTCKVIIVASGTNKTSEIRYMKNTNAQEKIKTRFYDKYTVRELI